MTAKKRGRPKSKKRYYFGDEQQDAIIEYNTNPDNFALRNKIYSKIIQQSLLNFIQGKEKNL